MRINRRRSAPRLIHSVSPKKKESDMPRKRLGIVLVIVLLTVAVQARGGEPVPAEEKAEFIRLLQGAPYKGEFLTEEGVDRLAPHIRILFALSTDDIAKYDLYPFLALGRGLCDRELYRQYGVAHFRDIAHPTLKLSWAAMLFDAGSASPEIVTYLRTAVASKEQSAMLADMLGLGFEGFKKRVLRQPVEQR